MLDWIRNTGLPMDDELRNKMRTLRQDIDKMLEDIDVIWPPRFKYRIELKDWYLKYNGYIPVRYHERPPIKKSRYISRLLRHVRSIQTYGMRPSPPGVGTGDAGVVNPPRVSSESPAAASHVAVQRYREEIAALLKDDPPNVCGERNHLLGAAPREVYVKFQMR